MRGVHTGSGPSSNVRATVRAGTRTVSTAPAWVPMTGPPVSMAGGSWSVAPGGRTAPASVNSPDTYPCRPSATAIVRRTTTRASQCARGAVRLRGSRTRSALHGRPGEVAAGADTGTEGTAEGTGEGRIDGTTEGTTEGETDGGTDTGSDAEGAGGVVAGGTVPDGTGCGDVVALGAGTPDVGGAERVAPVVPVAPGPPAGAPPPGDAEPAGAGADAPGPPPGTAPDV